MRLESIQHNVQSSGVMQTSKATIKATPKLFDMFADQTYSNKPEAIVRELTANAIDAHTAAGCPDRPVEVTLPTDLDAVFKVRDWGVGMSHEFLMGAYMAYTDGSTKDSSDDQIGGFGIGSKSPFAYTDAFTVRSVKDGVLGIYTVFKDTDGIPSIGLLGQVETDEHNGVEVSFPVAADDIQTFRDAAQNALQFFRPLPIVIGGAITAPDYTYVGKNWSMRPTAGPLNVIVGGIRYPVASYSLATELRYDSRLSPLIEYGLDLIMPIGSVGIAMSREGLSYTGKTSDSIKNALEAVVDDVINTFANLFDSAPSLWDARKMLQKEIGGNGYSTNARQKLLAANARYKGEKLTASFSINNEKLGEVWIVEGQHSRRHRTTITKAKWENLPQHGSFYPGQIQFVIIDDMPRTLKSKVTGRVAEYLQGQSHPIGSIVLRPDDGVSVSQLLAAFENPTDYILVSTLPVPAPKAKTAASIRPKVRMFTFTGGNHDWTGGAINNLKPGGGKTSVREIPYVDQPDDGKVLVKMTQFDLPSDFRKKMNTQLIGYNELVFVNEIDHGKIAANFDDFDTEFKKRLDDALAGQINLPERIALDNSRDLSSWFGFIRQYWKSTTFATTAAAERPFGRIVKLYDAYVYGLTDRQRLLAPFVDPKLPKGVDPAKLVETLEDKQPLLPYLRRELNMAEKMAMDLFIANV